MHNTLFVSNRYILFVGSGLDTAFHQHHAAQICLGLDAPFILSLNQEKPQKYAFEAVIIAPDVEHLITANDTLVASLFIEIESDEYSKILQKWPLARDEYIRPLSLPVDFYDAFKRCNGQSQNAQTLSQLCERMLAQLSGEKESRYAPEPRIQKVLNIIASCRGRQLSVDELADMVCLSPSRLIHLFKAEVGIPIRRYYLWRRIRVGIEHAVKHKNLTAAAHVAGFSDSAHFSNVFKKMFGIPPSLLTNSKRPTEVIFNDVEYK